MDRLSEIDKKSSLLLSRTAALKVIEIAGPILIKNSIPQLPQDVLDQISKLTCHEVGHPWNSSCVKTPFLLFVGSFKKNLTVYGSLYLEIFGKVSYWGSLLFNIPACFLSIIIERKQRRGLLAIYLTNLASETVFNMLAYRKLIRTVPNGEVLLFAIASAFYGYLFKAKLLEGSTFGVLKSFFGQSEVIENDPAKINEHTHKIYLELNRQSKVIKYFKLIRQILIGILAKLRLPLNYVNGILTRTEHRLEVLLNKFNNRQNRLKHPLCSHRYNCILNSIIGFVQRFCVGYLLQAAFKVLGSLGAIFKNPKILVKIFKSRVNTELGLFFGFQVLIFRIISCLLKYLTNKNHPIHGLISGFFSGWSMVHYKSSSIALYLNFKLFEILWMIGVKKKKLPLVKSFDSILYTLSTALVLWVALFEPHNIRPAYWKFLLKITDGKFGEVNRQKLDLFGTNASEIDATIKILSKK